MLTFEQVIFTQDDFSITADLTIAENKVTAIIGPSGAGKSTFLHGIAGFVQQTGGDLFFSGADISGQSPGKRPVSMLFQDNNLFPHLTILQNVALALTTKLRPSKAIIEEVEHMLSHVGLEKLSTRRPAELSGGQKSRVALARTLLQNRPVLLMDEPFSALGPALKDEMLDLSVSLAAHRTIVMVTHNPADAERIADEVIGVAEGQAFPPVPTATFMSNPPETIRDYFGAAAAVSEEI